MKEKNSGFTTKQEGAIQYMLQISGEYYNIITLAFLGFFYIYPINAPTDSLVVDIGCSIVSGGFLLCLLGVIVDCSILSIKMRYTVIENRTRLSNTFILLMLTGVFLVPVFTKAIGALINPVLFLIPGISQYIDMTPFSFNINIAISLIAGLIFIIYRYIIINHLWEEYMEMQKELSITK